MTVSDEAMVMTSETPVLRVTVANEVEAFEALREEWLALLAQIPRATAFQTPEWLATWWRMRGTNRQIWLLVVRRADGALIGLMPLQLQTFGPGRWGLRVLRWLGQDRTGLTDTLGALFAPGYEMAAAEAALAYLHEHDQDWDIIELPRTPGPLAQVLCCWVQEQRYNLAFFGRSRWLYVRLPADWPALQRTLSKNLRSNLARYRNRLVREGHTASVSMLTDPDSVVAALPEYFELHRRRSEARDLKHHSNYFRTPGSRAFATEMARQLSARGQLALAQMVVDGNVAAAQLLLFQGDTMSAYFSGFDPQWARYSVMMLLTRASVEYAFERGVQWIDLTAGAKSDQSKRQWGNEEFVSCHLLIARSRAQAVLAAQAMRAWYVLRRWQRRRQRARHSSPEQSEQPGTAGGSGRQPRETSGQ